MKKILLGVALVLVVAIGVVLTVVLSRLDTLVADAIESHGSRLLGTSVHVGAVDIDLREGRGTIRGLRVANPDGFSGDDAFRLDEIVLALDVGSLGSEPIVVDELRVRGPQARLEMDAAGRSNFQVLKSHVDAASAAPEAAAEEGPAEGEPTKLRIRRFAFEEGRVRADVSAIDPDREPFETELPAVRLQDVGGAGGAPPGAIGKTVLSAFTGQVVRTVAASQVQKEVEDRLGGSEAGRKAGELLRNVLE